MSDNLRIWSAVDKTDPSATKKVNQRGGFTAIDAYSQIKEATRQFGPIGTGWGYDARLIHEEGAVIAIVDLWYMDGKERRGPVTTFGCKKFSGERLDEDAPKKAVTDGLTKALSYLGFNADVFLGKFDDNKYVQERVREEAKNNAPPPPTDEDKQFCTALLGGIDTCASSDGLKTWAADHKEQIVTLPDALQKEVRDEYKTKLKQLEGNKDA